MTTNRKTLKTDLNARVTATLGYTVTTHLTGCRQNAPEQEEIVATFVCLNHAVGYAKDAYAKYPSTNPEKVRIYEVYNEKNVRVYRAG